MSSTSTNMSTSHMTYSHTTMKADRGLRLISTTQQQCYSNVGAVHATLSGYHPLSSEGMKPFRYLPSLQTTSDTSAIKSRTHNSTGNLMLHHILTKVASFACDVVVLVLQCLAKTGVLSLASAALPSPACDVPHTIMYEILRCLSECCFGLNTSQESTGEPTAESTRTLPGGSTKGLTAEGTQGAPGCPMQAYRSVGFTVDNAFTRSPRQRQSSTMDPSDTNHHLPAARFLCQDVSYQAQAHPTQDSRQSSITVPGITNFAIDPMIDTARSAGAPCSSTAQQVMGSQNPFATEPFPSYVDPLDTAAATSAESPMSAMADNEAGYQASETTIAGPSTPVPHSIDCIIPSSNPTPSSSRQLVMPEGRKKNGAPIDWNFTEKPVPYKGNGNGRKTGRNLINWTRPRMYEKLVLHMQYELNRHGVSVPWDYIAHRFHPGSSGQAIQQHLNRLRPTLIAEGHLVPPVYVKNRPPVPSKVRGLIRAEPEGDDCITTREVPWSEPIWDRQFNLPNSQADQSTSTPSKRKTSHSNIFDSPKKTRKYSDEMSVDSGHGDRDSMGYQPEHNVNSASSQAAAPPQATQNSMAPILQPPNAQSWPAPVNEQTNRVSTGMAMPPGTVWDEIANLRREIDLLHRDRLSREALHAQELARVRYDARTQGIHHGFMLARSHPLLPHPPLRNFESFQAALDNQPHQVYPPRESSYSSDNEQGTATPSHQQHQANPAPHQYRPESPIFGVQGPGPNYALLQTRPIPVAMQSHGDDQFGGHHTLPQQQFGNPYMLPQQQFGEGSSAAAATYNSSQGGHPSEGEGDFQMAEFVDLSQSTEGNSSVTQAGSQPNDATTSQHTNPHMNVNDAAGVHEGQHRGHGGVQSGQQQHSNSQQ